MVVALALLLLTALDIAASVAAKEAVAHRSVPVAVAGALLFVGMFYVLASVLASNADLAVITFGWSVLVQIGVLLLDRFRYDVHFTTRQWVAVAVVLAAQMYLLWPAHQPVSNESSETRLSDASAESVLAGAGRAAGAAGVTSR